MSSSMKLESNKEIYSHHLHDRNTALARAHQSRSTSLDVLGTVTRWKVGNLEKKINMIWPLLRPTGSRSAWVQCRFMVLQERPQPALSSTGCTLERCLCWLWGDTTDILQALGSSAWGAMLGYVLCLVLGLLINWKQNTTRGGPKDEVLSGNVMLTVF